MEYTKKSNVGPKLPATQSRPQAVPTPQPTWTAPELPPLQRWAADLTQFTSLPVTAQRQAVQPVLQAATLSRAEEGRLIQQRTEIQRQMAALPQGVQSRAPVPLPAQPVTSGDWVTVMRQQAERINGQRLSSREHDGFIALQRQVAQTLVQAFQQDRQAPETRYAQYGEHLATLQRHPNSAPVSRVVLGLIPQRERLPLQRAVDEALQRQAEQDAHEQAGLQFQALQRKKAELDEESLQPVMQRIAARRGAGHPLPEAVQRHLEQGLNHDLSGVRIHNDAEADKLSKKVNALAFTTGTDIFFQSGQFNPNTQSGLELLAHEVMHTVQQSKGQVGTGVDPDAGLEAEARTMGRRLAASTPPVRSGAKLGPRTVPSRAAFTPTTTFQRRAASTPLTAVPALVTVQKVGIIKHTDGTYVRLTPEPAGKLLLAQPLPVGQRVGVVSRTADGWSRISLLSGQMGYIPTSRVTTDLPDPGATLVKVPANTTAIGIAEQYYKAVIRPGQDYDYYVNVLRYLSDKRGTASFNGTKLIEGRVLWVPSPTFAQSLVRQVNSGSLTGGAFARAKASLGNSPGTNVLRSVMESPAYIGEVLGEAWKTVKQHWPVLLATTIALVSAELLVGVLAALPEPTTITKFLAVGLQSLVVLVAGSGVVVSTALALEAGRKWLETAWTAQGNASKIKAASKAFLTMIALIVGAVASAAGVKATLNKALVSPITASKGLAYSNTPFKQGGILQGVNPNQFQSSKPLEAGYLKNPYWTSIDAYPAVIDPTNLVKSRNALNSMGGSAAKMSDAELIAVRQYTTRAYVPLNSALRVDSGIIDYAKANGIVQQVVKKNMPSEAATGEFSKVLISAMNKLPKFSGPVFRGEGNDRLAQFLAMSPGDEWVESAFFSTSYQASASFHSKPMLFTIKSKTGVAVDEISLAPYEAEVLFKPGTKFKLISIKYDYLQNKHIIVAEEVK